MSPFALFYHQSSHIPWFPFFLILTLLLSFFDSSSFTSIYPWWDYESLLVLYFIFPFFSTSILNVFLATFFALTFFFFLITPSIFSSNHSSLSSWSDLWIILNFLKLSPFFHSFIPPKVPHSILHNCFFPNTFPLIIDYTWTQSLLSSIFPSSSFSFSHPLIWTLPFDSKWWSMNVLLKITQPKVYLKYWIKQTYYKIWWKFFLWFEQC